MGAEPGQAAFAFLSATDGQIDGQSDCVRNLAPRRGSRSALSRTSRAADWSHASLDHLILSMIA
jgi:hypothetical protein